MCAEWGIGLSCRKTVSVVVPQAVDLYCLSQPLRDSQYDSELIVNPCGTNYRPLQYTQQLVCWRRKVNITFRQFFWRWRMSVRWTPFCFWWEMGNPAFICGHKFCSESHYFRFFIMIQKLKADENVSPCDLVWGTHWAQIFRYCRCSEMILCTLPCKFIKFCCKVVHCDLPICTSNVWWMDSVLSSVVEVDGLPCQ